MSQSVFDGKFGAQRVANLSQGPGIYLFRDASSEVIYVGKAKNLRRRLSGYRNASRKKVHRKMRTLVREASSLEVRELATEEEALLEENRLIRELHPSFNVDGAYAFLYPAFGLGEHERLTLIAFTTSPEKYAAQDLSWFGVFRSRPRAKAALDALVELLSLIGHREKASRLPSHESARGSRLVGFRQVPPEIREALPWFFSGDESGLLGELAKALLAKPRARREAEMVQESLLTLRDFFERDTQPLRKTLRKLGKPGSYVSGDDRDSVFIQAQFSSDTLADETP